MTHVRTSSNTQDSLNSLESLIVGSIAGGVSALVINPLTVWKNSLQYHYKYPRTIVGWYRGVISHSFSSMLFAANFFTFNKLLQQQYIVHNNANTNFNDTTQNKLTSTQICLCAATAGSFSGLVLNPGLVLGIQQSVLQLNLQDTFRKLVFDTPNKRCNFRILFRGLHIMMFRESVTQCGIFAITPLVTEKLMVKLTHNNDDMNINMNNINPSFDRIDRDNEQTSVYLTLSFLSSITVGTLLAILSHPIETVRVVVTGDLYSRRYPKSGIKTAIMLYRESGGIKKFYSGIVPRCMGIICHTFICLQIKQWFANKKVQYRFVSDESIDFSNSVIHDVQS